MQDIIQPMNWVDRLVNVFSPRIAGQRVMQRTALALAGGYDGARTDVASLARYNPRAGSATTDIIPGLKNLRSRSRDQMRNSALALGAVNNIVSNVVGTGLSCKPDVIKQILGLSEEQADAWQNDTRQRFEIWAKSHNVSVNARLNFYGIQELAFRGMLESGDVFISTPLVNIENTYQLALQVIEADRVCNPNNQVDLSAKNIIDGIEIDPATSRTIAIHIAKQHPGDYLAKNEWMRREVASKGGRQNIIHLFKVLRADQVRGVPVIAPIIEPLKQLQRYTEAELNAAVISGLFSVFIKMDPDAFDDMYDDSSKSDIISKASNWSGDMQSGQAINLLPGEDIVSTNPGRPNAQFDPFWQAIVRQIGIALELPIEVLTMHFQSSYSAARAALLMAWKMYKSRREFLATYLCQPVYQLWLTTEISEGRINAPGFFSSPLIRAAWCNAIWTGDGPGAIDPVKEVEAAAQRVALGISTLDAECIAYDGVDFKTKVAQRAKEIQAQRQAGLQPAGAVNVPSPNEPDSQQPTEPPAQGEGN